MTPWTCLVTLAAALRRAPLQRGVAALLVPIALCVPAPARAVDDGFFDPAWGAAGRVVVPMTPRNDIVRDIAIQQDGKILLAGDCDLGVGAGIRFCVARLRSDGNVDFGFGPNETGRITFDQFPNFPSFNQVAEHGMALQRDGRILIAGTGQFYYGATLGVRFNGMLVRLSANGQLESVSNSYVPVSFSFLSSGPDNIVEAVAVAPDGKIVVAGHSLRASSSPPNRDFGIARFNADLSADSSFSGSGVRLAAFDLGGDNLDEAKAVAVQADGKIVVAGNARGADGLLKAALLRLNTDGSSDTSFGNGGRVWFDHSQGYNINVRALAIDRSGRIVVAGGWQRSNSSSADYDFFAARLTPQGALEPGFGWFGDGFTRVIVDAAAPFRDEAYDLAIQSDGKIVLAGYASRSASTGFFAAARLTAAGVPDLTFGSNGVSRGSYGADVDDSAFAAALSSGSRLFVAGSSAASSAANSLDFGIARLAVDLIYHGDFER